MMTYQLLFFFPQRVRLLVQQPVHLLQVITQLPKPEPSLSLTLQLLSPITHQLISTLFQPFKLLLLLQQTLTRLRSTTKNTQFTSTAFTAFRSTDTSTDISRFLISFRLLPQLLLPAQYTTYTLVTFQLLSALSLQHSNLTLQL